LKNIWRSIIRYYNVPERCDDPVITYQEWLYTICPDDPTTGIDCEDPVNFSNPECELIIEPVENVKDSLKKIMKDTCLNASQVNTLVSIFSAYIDGQGVEDLGCVQKMVYSKVLASGQKFGFCIAANIVGNGGYNATTKNIFWKYEAGIPVVSLFAHEFFHGFQDTFYTGGTAQYNAGTRTGFPNLEFEQALFYDIVNGSSNASAMGSTASQSLKDEYATWIETVTNNNTKYPKQFSDFGGQYYYFLTKFNQNANGYVGVGLVKTDLPPNTLLNIFLSSNCK
jgi:hypothetical protein